MNKVLLFNPRAGDNVRIIPNAILAIAASIEKQFDYVVVDGNREKDPLSKIIQYLSTGEFKFFASTVMPGPQLKQAIPFTKYVREQFPELKIIWGGYFASNHHKTVINSKQVDVVVNGPGDKTFPALLHAMIKNESFEHLENLVFLKDGKLIKTKKATLYEQDELPALPYDTLNTFYSIEGYLGKTFLGNRTIAYHSSIGCPFTCSFCGVVPIFDARWKGKSAQSIYKDLVYLKGKYHGNAFQFHDNNFFVSEKRAVEFANLIASEKMKWWAEGRIDTMDKFSDESLQAVADSGCTMIFFGAESGNNALLKQMDKGGMQTGEKIKSFAARIKKFGIIPEYSFVLGLPAPTEQQVWQQINDEIKFIKEIKAINPTTEIVIYIYTPVPTEGSELFDGSLDRGFKFPQTLEEWMQPQWLNFDLHREYLTPWLKPEMIRYIHDFETVVHAQYPTVSDYKLSSLQRKAIKMLSRIRYEKNIFSYPLELKALMKYWLKYRQPEIQGL
ncbi:MAG TPA: radical SAM protein [Cyclobacteriaceae bacterium]|nr:radical SAM protein [Cyclobacteriaceae bacterium]